MKNSAFFRTDCFEFLRKLKIGTFLKILNFCFEKHEHFLKLQTIFSKMSILFEFEQIKNMIHF